MNFRTVSGDSISKSKRFKMRNEKKKLKFEFLYFGSIVVSCTQMPDIYLISNLNNLNSSLSTIFL